MSARRQFSGEPLESIAGAASPNAARFRFYAELNDFLPPDRRYRESEYRFYGRPSVKDAIQAQGIPHTEIDLILVNGGSVGFDCPLSEGDRVAVYPVFESLDIAPLTRVRAFPLRRPAFILDVHLGKLARLLRMLGFDTLYENDLEDAEIIRTAAQERRVILTRDRGILKQKQVSHGYCLRSTDPVEQAREVLRRFDLRAQVKPLTRCIRCNGLIAQVPKACVSSQLPPESARYYDEFYQCQKCRRVYWRGSHFPRMQETIGRILS